MSALFKRKTREPEAETVDEVEHVDPVQTKGESRKKDGPTPKRQAAKKKRPPKNPPLTHKEARERAKSANAKLGKDTKQAQKAEVRAERARIAEGQDRGDPLFDKYHLPRDKGPERLVTRDLVDARRNVGQYFFILAILIIILSGQEMPPQVQAFGLAGWMVLLLAFIVDSFFLCRKVKRVVWKRFPKTTQRKGGLYWYAVSRSIMFRRLRMPRPRPGVDYRTKEADFGAFYKD
ncbi:MAG: DUF3043 domain-containing protein [Stackebrandtia sp.]